MEQSATLTTAYNMGFGAMAADEYILIVPFAALLHRVRRDYVGNF